MTIGDILKASFATVRWDSTKEETVEEVAERDGLEAVVVAKTFQIYSKAIFIFKKIDKRQLWIKEAGKQIIQRLHEALIYSVRHHSFKRQPQMNSCTRWIQLIICIFGEDLQSSCSSR